MENDLNIIIAAIVRLIVLRPQLNRLVMNGRIYARPKIWVSFVVHPTLKDESTGTTIKLCFEGTETILEVARRVTEAIEKETTKRVEENGTDKLLRFQMKRIPRVFIKLVINTLMWMDKHNLMPKLIVDLSPFHTSLFITNLKSLGINHVYHHVYNFGTTGLFFAMGKEKEVKFRQCASQRLWLRNIWVTEWFPMSVSVMDYITHCLFASCGNL